MAGKTEEKKSKLLTEEPDFEEFVDQDASDDIESLIGDLGDAPGGDAAEEEPQLAQEEEPQGEREPQGVEEEANKEDVTDESEEEGEEEFNLEEDQEEEQEAKESAELTQLRQELAEMKQLLQQKMAEPKEKEKEEPLTVPERNFLDGLDIEEVYSGEEGLNKLSNKIFKEAVSYVREMYLKDTPEMIKRYSPETSREVLRAEMFFRDNPDIASVDRSYVGEVAQKLAKKYPDMSSDKFYEVLPDVVRKQLKLKPAKGQKKTPRKRRNGPKPAGARREQAPRSEVDADIEAIMDVTPIV